MGSELPQHRDGGRLVVNEHSSLTTRGNLPPQDQLFVAGIDAVFYQHRVKQLRVGFEYGGDDRLVSSVAHSICRGFIAQQQCQCINQDGFASASFAGQEIQTGRKLHGNVVDDRVVFNPQFQQHSAFSTRGNLVAV